MATMVALSLLCGCVAGFAAYICAYDHAFPTQGKRAARQAAKRAIPFPFLYFCVLGFIVSFVLPILARRYA